MGFVNCYNESRTLMACGSDDDGSIHFVDVKSNYRPSGSHIPSDHLQSGIVCLDAISPSECVVGYSDGKLKSLDMRTGVYKKGTEVNRAGAERISCVAISSYDQRVCYSDGAIVGGQLCEHKLGISSAIHAAAFTSESTLVSGHEDGCVLLWDLSDAASRQCEYSGHLSRVERVVYSKGNTWVASCGQSDLHVGIWSLVSTSEEHSLATNAGPVVHMEALNTRLAILCKHQVVLLYNITDALLITLHKRISLSAHSQQPAIGVLIGEGDGLYVVHGSPSSLQICTTEGNEISCPQSRPNLSPSHKSNDSIQDSLGIYNPVPITNHRVSVLVSLEAREARAACPNGVPQHVDVFQGALRAGDNKVLKSLLTDRSESEISECVSRLSEELRLTFMEYLSSSIKSSARDALNAIPWIEECIRRYPTSTTENLICLFEHRHVIFTYLVKLNSVMGLTRSESLLANTEDRQNPKEDEAQKQQGVFSVAK